MNIVLTGFMATGKSAVGKILAEKLGYVFFDTDAMIEKDTGLTISQIFANKGEPAFRDMETKALALLALFDKTVVATGGGIPLRKENMDILEKNGFVVRLTAEPATILERLEKEGDTRPLLSDKTKDPLLAVEEILAKRETAYARCRAAVATDGLSAEQVAEKIMEQFKKSHP